MRLCCCGWHGAGLHLGASLACGAKHVAQPLDYLASRPKREAPHRNEWAKANPKARKVVRKYEPAAPGQQQLVYKKNVMHVHAQGCAEVAAAARMSANTHISMIPPLHSKIAS